MAHRLIRPAGRTKAALELARLSSQGSKTPLYLLKQQHSLPSFNQNRSALLGNLNYSSLQLPQRRCYVSEMRKAAFEGNILRLLRNEIQYELDCSFSPLQSVATFNSFAVDERPGRQWIRLNKKFGDDEDIKLEVTMLRSDAPFRKRRGMAIDEDVSIFVTTIVEIRKGKGSDVLEFECSTWPDSIEIEKVIIRSADGTAGRPYMGPPFLDLDDEFQESLYNFLESRGINDELAGFLHKYMQNKCRTEYIQWLRTVKSIIEKKV